MIIEKEKNKHKKMKKTHTLIISDFHLGSKVSRSEKIIELLKNIDFKKLILLGDIFENLNFGHLRESDWKLLFLISEISKKKKIIWVEGNHDKGLTKIFNLFPGTKVFKVYRWKFNGKKYLAIHGHQFDSFMINNFFLSYIANEIYNFIQLIDFSDNRISRFIKRKSKGWLRLSKKVANRAILYAQVQRVDYIFCGHTHKSDQKKKGKTHYYNSGCWTDVPETYITVDKEEIKIEKFNLSKTKKKV